MKASVSDAMITCMHIQLLGGSSFVFSHTIQIYINIPGYLQVKESISFTICKHAEKLDHISIDITVISTFLEQLEAQERRKLCGLGQFVHLAQYSVCLSGSIQPLKVFILESFSYEKF